MWKIKKIIRKGDYDYALVPNHPRATKNGYVLHHRVVMENFLQRILNSDEVVHHKDDNKKNNRIENLEVMTLKEHTRMHGLQRGRMWCELKCPNCGIYFIRAKNKCKLFYGSKICYCSRQCSGKMSRDIQFHGITHEMENAISENLVREFIAYDNSEVTVDNRHRRDYTHSA